jgi:hypothetical protein
VIYTRLAQELPARVEDPIIIARILDLISPSAGADYQGEKSEL